MTMDKSAAALHLLACYVLYCMKQEIIRSHYNNIQKDNRLVYEAILFLCGDRLRAESEQDLGMQTKCLAPSKKSAIWKITYETIQCVVNQCQEQGWMTPIRGENANYQLTQKGEVIAKSLTVSDHTNSVDVQKLIALFTPKILFKLDEQVKILLSLSKIKLDEEVRKTLKRAYQSSRLVAHYDLSDPALKPYFTGELSF